MLAAGTVESLSKVTPKTQGTKDSGGGQDLNFSSQMLQNERESNLKIIDEVQ